jgi:hypothetical protein
VASLSFFYDLLFSVIGWANDGASHVLPLVQRWECKMHPSPLLLFVAVVAAFFLLFVCVFNVRVSPPHSRKREKKRSRMKAQHHQRTVFAFGRNQ